MSAGFDGRIGIALGSGAARGWAHVGVLRALREAGIEPEFVCGTSSGALVGALYAAERLDALEKWARQLDRRQIFSLFDFSLRGGLIKARKVLEAVGEELGDATIESLPRRFAAVATDLATGREIWLRSGALLPALRASIALPGLVTPVQIDGRWMVDGGLVNAVPISLCRALGADSVIAVDLNTTLLRRRFSGAMPAAPVVEVPQEEHEDTAGMFNGFQEFLTDMRERLGGGDAADRDKPPSFFDVIANAINIMQVRITRSRMAGDPPELLITPQLADFSIYDFDRAGDAIEAGHRAANRALSAWRESGASGPERIEGR
ncbi:MAG: patatin-like phospholipase family protein [Myxococcales bacterium]|nr:patatin-like phospholipase family protein [Myxococcales bacterium]MDH5305585.1 patatin-like phospholipase family protein [Myxococcales bacterium]MDH5567486.1 patatin-like phospholipase family protein [Myxococcales bacterium]